MAWFDRLKKGLTRSSESLLAPMKQLLRAQKVDAETLEALEEILIQGDMGLPLSQHLITQLKKQNISGSMAEIQHHLARSIEELLSPCMQSLTPDPHHAPWVCLMVGVNGSGKTTTLGKLAYTWRASGFPVQLVAGDTFRAAAVEQLQVWGARASVPVKIGQPNCDAASLAFEALSETSQGILAIDTAGRLHTKQHLMEELSKMIRVLRKKNPELPHACILVLDAGAGQNNHVQVKMFKEAVPLSGIIMTKLDGTARGGSLVSLAHTFKLPIHAVGVGEAVEDLQPFDAGSFAKNLLGLNCTS